MPRSSMMPRSALVNACKAVNSLRFIVKPFQGMSEAEMEEKLNMIEAECYAASSEHLESDAEWVHVSRGKRTRWLTTLEELESCTQAKTPGPEAQSIDFFFRRLRAALLGKSSVAELANSSR